MPDEGKARCCGGEERACARLEADDIKTSCSRERELGRLGDVKKEFMAGGDEDGEISPGGMALTAKVTAWLDDENDAEEEEGPENEKEGGRAEEGAAEEGCADDAEEDVVEVDGNGVDVVVVVVVDVLEEWPEEEKEWPLPGAAYR